MAWSGDRGWDGWMASPTQWTGVWANSERWWRTGKPGVLQSMGSWRVRHNFVTEQQITVYMYVSSSWASPYSCSTDRGHHRAPRWAHCAIPPVPMSCLFYTCQGTYVHLNLPVHPQTPPCPPEDGPTSGSPDLGSPESTSSKLSLSTIFWSVIPQGQEQRTDWQIHRKTEENDPRWAVQPCLLWLVTCLLRNSLRLQIAHVLGSICLKKKWAEWLFPLASLSLWPRSAH